MLTFPNHLFDSIHLHPEAARIPCLLQVPKTLPKMPWDKDKTITLSPTFLYSGCFDDVIPLDSISANGFSSYGVLSWLFNSEELFAASIRPNAVLVEELSMANWLLEAIYHEGRCC